MASRRADRRPPLAANAEWDWTGLDGGRGEGRGGDSPAVPEELAWGHCPHPHAPSAAMHASRRCRGVAYLYTDAMAMISLIS
jgi:hypothetical protein